MTSTKGFHTSAELVHVSLELDYSVGSVTTTCNDNIVLISLWSVGSSFTMCYTYRIVCIGFRLCWPLDNRCHYIFDCNKACYVLFSQV